MHHDGSKKVERVLVFDWDDTLCPSSFFERDQIDNAASLPEHARQLLDEIVDCAERCLQEASKYGEVLIITNSDEGWVQYSCERLLPRLLPALKKYKIISARTAYEKFYPGQPLCWKSAAFAHQVNESFQSFKHAVEKLGDSAPSLDDSDVSSEESFDVGVEARREIISFGDSMEERTAARIVSNQLDSLPKTVMFLASPTPVQLIGQLHLLAGNMEQICEKRESTLDIEISHSQTNAGALSYAKQRKLEDLIVVGDETTIHQKKRGGIASGIKVAM